MGQNINVSSAYAISFGGLDNNTRYVDLDLKSFEYKTDIRGNMFGQDNVELKALGSTSGGAGTAGFALVPIYVDPKIIDESRKNTPLTEIIPRVSNFGLTADFNNIEAKGGGFVAAEDASLTETDTTFARNSTPIKFLYAVGRVTGVARAALPPYALQGFSAAEGAVGAFGDQSAPNAKQLEVLIKAREIKELEENLIINGDTSSDPNEFDGFIKLMGADNTVAKGTTALDLDDIQTAIDNAFSDGGRPNFAVCSSGVYTDLLNLLTAKIGFLQATEKVFWGFQSIVLHTMVGAIPVIPSQFMSNTPGSKAIYFLDMQVMEIRVLQDLTYEELAKTNDSEKFMLKMYETLIIRNTSFSASITEIA